MIQFNWIVSWIQSSLARVRPAAHLVKLKDGQLRCFQSYLQASTVRTRKKEPSVLSLKFFVLCEHNAFTGWSKNKVFLPAKFKGGAKFYRQAKRQVGANWLLPTSSNCFSRKSMVRFSGAKIKE